MKRGMGAQVAQLQKESTPGAAVTSAMQRLMSLKLTPGINVEGGDAFFASGYKVPTAYQVGDTWSVWNVEGVQDYNGIGYVLTSILGRPESTPVDGADGAYEHVWTPKSDDSDDLTTYTIQWGSPDRAIQAVYFVFQSLTLGVQRGQLSFGSGGLSRTFESASLATTGITTVPAAVIPSRGYNVYIDDAWEGLGTTKALACYTYEVTNPDKYATDAPINAAVSGFEHLMENEDLAYAISMSLGFDAAGDAEVEKFKQEAMRFLRIEAVGGKIGETSENYTIEYDVAALLTGIGNFETAPNSSTVVVPFEGTMMHDPVSEKFQQVRIVNAVASY